jgi:sugar phosphate isomerase/epimerase
MEFACHAWAFNDLPLTEALGTIARLGFRYVDIGTGPHLDTARVARDPRGAAAEIKRDLEVYNLRLSDVYLMLPRISLADDERRRKDIDLFRALLPFVVALETPGVTLSPGLIHPEDDDEAFDRTAAALREMISSARSATPATRLQVSIEPHMDSMAQTPAAARKLVEQVDGLALTLDWAQMVCQDVFHDDIAALIPHTRHVQLRQAARAQLQTPFDQGRIDVGRVVDSLLDARYEGVVCVEYMQVEGWHGMIKVNSVLETARLRDALRDARNLRQPATEL